MRSMKKSKLALACFLTVLCICAVVGPLCLKARAEKTSTPACEIVIENLTLGQEMPDLNAVEEAVNAITLPTLNCTVKIKNIPIANQKSSLRLMRAQNEPIDLVNTGRTDPLTDMVGDGLLLPLDALLAEYGGTLLDANRAVLDACRIDGELYAIPARSYVDSASGFLYNAELAETYGIRLSEYPDLEELERIAAILKEHGIYLTLPNARADTPWLFTGLYPEIRPISSNLYYGVLTQVGQELRVENTFTTAAYRDYCIRMRKWVENGWVPDRYLLSGINATEEFMTGKVFMIWNGVNPIELSLQSRRYPFRIGLFATGQTPLTTQTVLENGWGISSSCESPEMAMRLLNFIYENEEVANLLMNGLEGREYQKVSEHIITYLDGETDGDLKYLRQFTMFGDYRKVYEWSPMTEADFAAMQDYCASAPVLDELFGYTFNAQPVLAEANAVFEVLSDYLPVLECGLVEDVPAALDTLNEKLQQAGIETILAENQRQLDAWLRVQAENG